VLYFYSAEVIKVHDGDTVFLNIDMGRGIFHRDTDRGHRLWGINAPELNTDKGVQAGSWLTERLKQCNNQLFVHTIKAPKGFDKRDVYGRYLAVLYDQNGLDDYQRALDKHRVELHFDDHLRLAFRMRIIPFFSINQKILDAGHAMKKFYR